MSLRKIR